MVGRTGAAAASASMPRALQRAWIVAAFGLRVQHLREACQRGEILAFMEQLVAVVDLFADRRACAAAAASVLASPAELQFPSLKGGRSIAIVVWPASAS